MEPKRLRGGTDGAKETSWRDGWSQRDFTEGLMEPPVATYGARAAAIIAWSTRPSVPGPLGFGIVANLWWKASWFAALTVALNPVAALWPFVAAFFAAPTVRFVCAAALVSFFLASARRITAFACTKVQAAIRVYYSTRPVVQPSKNKTWPNNKQPSDDDHGVRPTEAGAAAPSPSGAQGAHQGQSGPLAGNQQGTYQALRPLSSLTSKHCGPQATHDTCQPPKEKAPRSGVGRARF